MYILLLKMLSKTAGNMVKLVDWADRWLKVILEVRPKVCTKKICCKNDLLL